MWYLSSGAGGRGWAGTWNSCSQCGRMKGGYSEPTIGHGSSLGPVERSQVLRALGPGAMLGHLSVHVCPTVARARPWMWSRGHRLRLHQLGSWMLGVRGGGEGGRWDVFWGRQGAGTPGDGRGIRALFRELAPDRAGQGQPPRLPPQTPLAGCPPPGAMICSCQVFGKGHSFTPAARNQPLPRELGTAAPFPGLAALSAQAFGGGTTEELDPRLGSALLPRYGLAHSQGANEPGQVGDGPGLGR